MATCPAGHDSATADYCDDCGTPMGGAVPAAAVPASAPVQRCANCGAARDGRFCEVCGHDGAMPATPPVTSPPVTSPPTPQAATSPQPATPQPALAPPGEWSALVQADRTWFEEVRSRGGPDAAELEFPRYCLERRFVLSGPRLAIGRRSRSRGTEPEIDLAGPPLDPGVSAQHALLLARPDGSWELVDIGSTNGTTVGDATEPITPNTPVPLAHGDRIKLGAWTTITVAYAAGRAQRG